MGLFVCDIHGAQNLVAVSPRFAKACDAKKTIPADWVCLVIIQSDEHATWTRFVDIDDVRAAGLDPQKTPLILTDRNRSARQLNDRLLIKTLFPPRAGLHRCQACLAQAIEPDDAPHLQMPAPDCGAAQPAQP